jgi:RNA-directed DNA polymerase
MRELMGKLKLQVNEEKTRICMVPQGQFDFLGYTFGRRYSKTTGKARLAMWPSKKSIRRMVEKVYDLTTVQTGWQETTEKVAGVGQCLEQQVVVGGVLRHPGRNRQAATCLTMGK